MKRQLSKRKLLIVFSLVLLTFGCGEVKKDVKDKKNNIDMIIGNMSIDEKIAQMLIIDYDYDYLENDMIEKLKNNPPSGLILLKNNITTYEKTKKLVNEFKSNSKYPLIISIDEEGGSVQRLNNLSDKEVTNIPFMNELGNINDLDLTYKVGKVIAEEVRTVGVNVDFAPVMDVFSNENNKVIGRRSFSSDPEIVSNHGLSLAKGLFDNKVIPVFKHFPGHGDTDIDSHLNLPVINKNKEELNSLELISFKNIVKDAQIIMVGHIALPEITKNNTPASLSKDIIDILKDDLKYDGLIVTDALNMGALTENYSNEEIYLKAIEAGNDLLLMPKDGINTINYIKNKISEDRINESVRKILKFKYKYLSDDNALDETYLNSDGHKNVIQKVLESS